MTRLISLIVLGLIACDTEEPKPDDSGTTLTDSDTTTTLTDTETSTADTTDTTGTTDTTHTTDTEIDTGPLDPCDEDGLTVNLGTGEDTYVPVADGESIGLAFGEQGGWHFFAGFEVYQSHQIVTFEVAGYDADTGTKVCHHGESPLQVALVPAEECRQIYYQIYCYLLCPMDESLVEGECDTPNEVLVERDIRLEINITDYDGKEGTDTLLFKAGPDGINSTECIADGICGGGGDTDLDGKGS